MSRAVASDEVIDIFAAAGLKKPDLSILSDEFLADVVAIQRRMVEELGQRLARLEGCHLQHRGLEMDQRLRAVPHRPGALGSQAQQPHQVLGIVTQGEHGGVGLGQVAADVVFEQLEPLFAFLFIDGNKGLFVAMPSRKLHDRCPACAGKNHIRARFCNDCGHRLKEGRGDLDDRGRVYVGSGDGHLYALDRTTGDVVWTFAADDPSVTGAYTR